MLPLLAPSKSPSPSSPSPSSSLSPRPPPTPLLLPPPPQRRPATPVSVNQVVISKQAPKIPNFHTDKVAKESIFVQVQPRRTNPLVWCGAIVCLIFSLVLILFGIATLIVYLVVKPKTPLFDTPNASLTAIYFDTPEYFNGDFTFLANFSNPNRKIDIRFEYLDIELYFADRLISTQFLQPFTQRPKETRLEAVHLISSLVYLPQNHAVALRTQVQSNRVNYNIRGTFKVKASLGMIHFTYWLHSRCQLQMTGPPTGALVARSCRTKR
ncbi:hypothetical protein UlMin_003957 [Ulmus minor]